MTCSTCKDSKKVKRKVGDSYIEVFCPDCALVLESKDICTTCGGSRVLFDKATKTNRVCPVCALTGKPVILLEE